MSKISRSRKRRPGRRGHLLRGRRPRGRVDGFHPSASCCWSGLENLEPRLLLNGVATAGNVFARFEGAVDAPGGSSEFAISIDPEDFVLERGTAILGFHVDSLNGLDPAAVQVRDDSGAVVAPGLSRDDVSGGGFQPHAGGPRIR